MYYTPSLIFRERNVVSILALDNRRLCILILFPGNFALVDKPPVVPIFPRSVDL